MQIRLPLIYYRGLNPNNTQKTCRMKFVSLSCLLSLSLTHAHRHKDECIIVAQFPQRYVNEGINLLQFTHSAQVTTKLAAYNHTCTYRRGYLLYLLQLFKYKTAQMEVYALTTCFSGFVHMSHNSNLIQFAFCEMMSNAKAHET